MHSKGTFVDELRSSASVDDRDEAERMLGAVLHALHDRLGSEADHLVAQLPSDVKPLVDPGEGDGVVKLSWDEFIERVAHECAIDLDRAEEVTRSVFHVLKEHISDGEARHVSAQLPRDLKDAWAEA